MKILHITAHMGGGVGKAIAALTQACRGTHEQRILLLESPLKTLYVDICKAHGIQVYPTERADSTKALLEWADVAVLNWWHHPKMAELLANFPRIPVRMLLWSHINGCTYPYLPYSFASAMCAIGFTSAYSLENPHWNDAQRREISGKSKIVYGIGRYEGDNPVKQTYSAGGTFTVGYVGTLNYGKIHPQFAQYCLAAYSALPEICFELVGEEDAALTSDFRQVGLLSRVRFTGHVTDVEQRLPGYDAFGYLLHPDHFGTTENALIEAMLAGVPVIAQNQSAERFILRNGQTGLLVNTPQEYAAALHALHEDPALGEKIGRAGHKYALSHYNLEQNAQRFLQLVDAAVKIPKQEAAFPIGRSPQEWFLHFLPPEEQAFFLDCMGDAPSHHSLELLWKSRPIYRQAGKSSVYHFLKYYPQNIGLQRLAMRLSAGFL